ncbi:MAG: flagellar hook-associated protein FlgL [Myxococcota bacterium]
MRISDQSYYALNRQSLQARRADVQKAQVRAASGKRVEKPSDDPIAASRAAKERAREQRLRASERSLDAGRTRVDVQEQALGDIAERLRRAKELSVQANNDTLSANVRDAVAVEVREISEAIRSLANARDGESYVFSGFASDAPAFDAAGVYQGDGGIPTIEVAEGPRIPAGVAGDTAFGVGVDPLFSVLADFEAALLANDEAALQATLQRIDDASERVILARSEVGGSQAAIDIARETVIRVRDYTIEAQQALVGIDETDAFTELQQVTVAYQAAVQIASQVPQPGLVNR